MQDEVVVIQAEARQTLQDLAAALREPLRRLGAERAVAFGSWARGEADGFSDLDLAVVIATDLPRLERGRLLGPLYDAVDLGLDPLVFTPEEFDRGTRRGLGVFDAIRREGVTLYERHD